MTGRLDGKVAIVTGASRGIGRATALMFAGEGAGVCVNYSKSEEKAQVVVDEISRSGGQAIKVHADVASAEQAREMAEKVMSRFGTIDILVNNAGVVRTADILSMHTEELDEMFRVNVKGTVNCTMSVMNEMIRKKSGKIVNIGSIAALGTAFSGTTAYASTKAAVATLTKRFAFELGRYGVNVNCVAPGFVRTDQTEAGRSPAQFAEVARSISEKTILGRIGDPIDIANAALFFASDQSNFVTGQILVVDGGRMDFLTHSI
jgi:3-oxoacyl-[acyl-carrier protein] reductase